MTDPTAHDHHADPADQVASDALDAQLHGGAPTALDEAQLLRMQHMAGVRARLKDDPDAPSPAQVSAMIADALRRTADDASEVVGAVPAAAAAAGTRRHRRPSVIWIGAAAAALLIVVGVSVFAGTRQFPEEEQSAVVPDVGDADTSRDTADDPDGAEVPSIAAPIDPTTTSIPPIQTSEAMEEAEDSGLPVAPAAGSADEGADPVPPASSGPGTGDALPGRAGAMAGLRLLVVVPLS